MPKYCWMAATGAVGAFAAATYLGMTWGSTPEERRRWLLSDDLVPEPSFTTNHAITMGGRAGDVWPWLVQTGWHRAGWYTYRWVDQLLFPANTPSATEILPERQGLAVGDHVPDGPPERGCYFVVERMEAPHLLVLRSHTHLPPRPRDAWLDWVWTWSITDLESDRVRVHLRTRGVMGPPWLALAYRAGLWTDFVMARSHLRGLKERVELRGRGRDARTPPGRTTPAAS